MYPIKRESMEPNSNPDKGRPKWSKEEHARPHSPISHIPLFSIIVMVVSIVTIVILSGIDFVGHPFLVAGICLISGFGLALIILRGTRVH
jgi:hypothetical protein